jgi:tRNA pseudouridine55 synthase
MYSNIQDGILLINKEKNKTSFQIIAELRKILNIKKIGHSGTLDKNATGLLIIGIGRSTKLLKHFTKLPKKYIAEIYFGKQTNTDDANGIPTKSFNGKIDLNQIKSNLNSFKGKINQIPPDYSAVHIDGKRSYQIAKKNQKPKLKKRIVEVNKLKIISFKNPFLKLDIECSSGTYIRSIARDLGIKTGYYAYLYSLIREKIGVFNLKKADTLKNINSGNFKIISPFKALKDIDSIEINKNYINDIKNGKKIIIDWFKENNIIKNLNNGYYKLHYKNELLAIIEFNNGNFKYDLVY